MGLSNLEKGLVEVHDLLLEDLRPGLLGQGRSLHNYYCRRPTWDAWTNEAKIRGVQHLSSTFFLKLLFRVANVWKCVEVTKGVGK